MPIDHVRIVSVPVSDQNRVRDFHVNALDWELVGDNDEGDRRRVEVAPEHGQTSVTPLCRHQLYRPRTRVLSYPPARS